MMAGMLLFPSAVSFAHIFSGHTHEVCINYADDHFHAKSLDCDLHSFHKNPAVVVNFVKFEPVLSNTPTLKFFDFYQFLSDYQKLPYELRGPPLSA